MELIFYALSNEFKPNIHSEALILDFIKDQEIKCRNFDWLSFHFLRLLNQKASENHLLPSNMEDYMSGSDFSELSRLLKKVLLQVEQSKV